jgi:hypothetical protein
MQEKEIGNVAKLLDGFPVCYTDRFSATVSAGHNQKFESWDMIVCKGLENQLM